MYLNFFNDCILQSVPVVVAVAVVTGAVVTAAVFVLVVVRILSVEGDLVVAGSDPPEQVSVLGTVIPTIRTAKMTLAIALIVTRKL